MMSDIAIGGRVRAMRRNREWTLQEVANKSGLSVSYLSDIERGRTNPSMATAAKLAEVFGMELAELFEGAELALSAGEYRLLDAWRSGKWAELLALVSAKIAEEYEQ